MAHDPVQVVRVQIVHPELQSPQGQAVKVSAAAQRVHHEPHHQRQVRQEGGQPCRHREAQLDEDVLDRDVLRAVVQLAQLRKEQREEREDLLRSVGAVAPCGVSSEVSKAKGQRDRGGRANVGGRGYKQHGPANILEEP